MKKQDSPGWEAPSSLLQGNKRRIKVQDPKIPHIVTGGQGNAMQVSSLTPGAKKTKQLNYVSVKNFETKYVLAQNMKNRINISAIFN